MIKLLCLDLDGTLLNSNQEVTEITKQKLVEVLDTGIRIYFVSGRPYCFTKHLALSIDKRIEVVSSNGGNYEIKNTICSNPIGKEAMEEVVDVLSKSKAHAFFKGIKNFYTNDTYDDRFLYEHCNDEYPEFLKVCTTSSMEWEQIKNKASDVDKILVYTDTQEELIPLRKQIDQIAGISTTSYNPISFDINANGISKGEAISNIMQEVKVSKAEVMAIGDSENDLAMFEASGLCVAMQNATAAILSVCNDVSASNDEDGVARAIDKHIFKKETM